MIRDDRSEMMYCPVCRMGLEVVDRLRLQTLHEHVANPNAEPAFKDAYECLNSNCQTNGKAMWNYLGEFYTHRGVGYRVHKDWDFIDGNTAPFNSWERKMNVELRKDDEDIYMFKNLFGITLKLEYNYTADYNGNIITKDSRFVWYKKYEGYRVWVGVGFKGFLKALVYWRKVLSW